MATTQLFSTPFGIFSRGKQRKRLAVRYEQQVVDLYALAEAGCFADLGIPKNIFRRDDLNAFIELGKTQTNAVRIRLQELLSTNPERLQRWMYPETTVQLHLPIKIGDYTDFYSSEQHAFNVGAMFRDPNNALLPNWKHLPVAYHGRASSIFVSGTPFRRPQGQLNASDQTLPTFGPSKRLDIELEMATIIGRSNPIGQPIGVNEAEAYVFGFALFNDWSARDIQRWEYVPLGPFLSKNFFSAMGAWIVPIEDLAPFQVSAAVQDPAVLPYLQENNRHHFDLHLDVYLQPDGGEPELIIQSNFKHLYWTVAQQIAHHTVNGCNLNVGDVLASGTISGQTPESFGSLLELTWGGKNPIQLAEGITRTFLEDGDTILIKGYAEKNGARVDFGTLESRVLPAIKPTLSLP